MDINYCDTWLRRRKSSFCSGTQTLSPPNVNYSLKRWLQQGIDEKYKQLNQYRFIQEIGQGSYGIVKLAYNEEDKNLYALKVLDKMKLLKNFACFRPPPTRRINNYSSVRFPRDPIKAVQREIAILKKLSHPNIVKLVEVLSDPNDRYLYMVFELLENGPVLEIPTDKPLDEKTAWLYFRDTVKGLEYLHRDIKPSNLLLSETGHVKIADFGISYEFQGIDAFLCGTAGTPAFMAPEALTEDSSCFYSGRAQDIWSLGVTLYAFVYGVVPFWDSYVIALHKKIKNDAVNFPKTQVHNKQIFEIANFKFTQKDPGLRLMLNEIKEHNWVTQNGRYPMPSETTNCELITVTNEEIQNCVRNIPHLDTLILIKFMVHRRRFGNPFKIMRKTSECNSLLTTNRHNEKIIKSDISKSMDVLNAKTKNLLLNAGTIKANRSESVDKKVNRSSGSWL